MISQMHFSLTQRGKWFSFPTTSADCWTRWHRVGWSRHVKSTGYVRDLPYEEWIAYIIGWISCHLWSFRGAKVSKLYFTIHYIWLKIRIRNITVTGQSREYFTNWSITRSQYLLSHKNKTYNNKYITRSFRRIKTLLKLVQYYEKKD